VYDFLAFDPRIDGEPAKAIQQEMKRFWFYAAVFWASDPMESGLCWVFGRRLTAGELSWLRTGRTDGTHYAPHPWTQLGIRTFGPIKGQNEWMGGSLRGLR